MIDTAPSPSRVQSLDLVRGVAVMGILLLNIIAFAMPEAAYVNPHAYGGAEGVDLAVYLANFVLFDGKMRGLFSFLFGASMLLVIDRAEAKDEDPAGVHYRRMLWLLLFGLAHLWLLWWGDILTLYAMVGMIAYAGRQLSVRALIGAGVALVMIGFGMMLIIVFVVSGAVDRIHSSDPAAEAEAARSLLEFTKSLGTPPASAIAGDLALHRGDYASILAARFNDNVFAPVANLVFFGWETLAYMFFGMAALKSGLLRNAWPRAKYLRLVWLGFGIGLPAYAGFAAVLIASDFSLQAITLYVMALPALVRPVMILGWACLILLLARPGGALTTRIAAAGRMAFTNYLATSLICTTLFYGYGLGWYGHLGRAHLYLVVFAVCALMLLWSKPWLARFRYGPFEWLWRSLSRWQLQPIRGAAALSD
jgi:uncharacterized protein